MPSSERLSVATTKSTPASGGTRSGRRRCRPRRGRAASSRASSQAEPREAGQATLASAAAPGASGPRRRLRRIARSGSCERYARIARHFASRSRDADVDAASNGAPRLPGACTAARRSAPTRVGRARARERAALQPGVVGMGERRPRHEHEPAPVHGARAPRPTRRRRLRAGRSRRSRTGASAA